MGLSSNINVWNTCLRVLRLQGFALRVDGETSDDGCDLTEALWIAEKDGFIF